MRARPPRHGEDPAECRNCQERDEGIWFNDHWRLARVTGVGVPLALMLYPRDHYDMADLPDDLAAELGLLTTRVVRHVQALPHISRAHVYRIGDGAAHLHVWFFARPEGQAQLFGSWLVVWDDLLPEYPADIAEADAAIVADASGRLARGPPNGRLLIGWSDRRGTAGPYCRSGTSAAATCGPTSRPAASCTGSG